MSEPTYECDYQYQCECTKDDIEGEWEWDVEQECWVCIGCGEIQ